MRPGRGTIQRYAEQDIGALDGTGKMSQGGSYFLPDSYGGGLIYVKTGAAAPLHSSAYRGEITVGADTYQGYAPNTRQFYRDCLHTAEEIISGQQLDYKQGGDYSRIAGTNKLFGESEAKNISRATRYAQGDAAAPNLGQAYLIVNTQWPNGVIAPYHAAGVVAVDGSDRITLEVFATSAQSRSRNQSGDYKMYSTVAGSGDTFHGYWQANFFGAHSVTTVLEPN